MVSWTKQKNRAHKNAKLQFPTVYFQ